MSVHRIDRSQAMTSSLNINQDQKLAAYHFKHIQRG